MKLDSFFYSSVGENLENGMGLVLIPRKMAPLISFQVFYSVGSKNENDSNRGIAHMLEHMIFKGTKTLPEGALDKVIYKLSGSTNAFTSYDYTGYTFETPSCNYETVLKLIYEFMHNPSFKQEYLNSELKAVFQELKMYKDDNISVMVEESMRALFSDHNYKNPIIGYKEKIVNYKRKDLINFFKSFYKKENIILVVAGDFEEKDFLKNAEKNLKVKFEKVENFDKKVKKKALSQTETNSYEIIVKRDVEVPHFLISWKIPGISENNAFIYDIFSIFFGSGRGSLIYKKLVQEKELATDVDVFTYDLFDYACLYIYIQPKSLEFIEKIKKEIFELIDLIKNKNYEEIAIERCLNKAKMSYIELAENNTKLAYTTGKYILATGKMHDINSLFSLKNIEIKEIFSKLCSEYLNDFFSCSVLLSPFKNEEEKEAGLKNLEKIDKEDAELLSRIPERKNYSKKNFNFEINAKEPKPCALPEFKKIKFSNNLTLYTFYSEEIDKIDICIDFKSKHYFDENKMQGRMSFLFDLMEEGTKKYPENKFGENLENFGMDFETSPGAVSLTCLPKDIEEAFKILKEYIFYPQFSEKSFNRVKEQRITDIMSFLDDSSCVSKQKIRELVYKNHPYGKNPAGTIETNKSFSIEDIKEGYRKYITPDETVFIISGPIKGEKLEKIFKSYFEEWEGEKIFPVLKNEPEKIEKFSSIKYDMNKDQSIITFGGLSVKRFDDKYNSLLVFDQIFGGGVGGNMNSKLFSLREKTGYFYSIGGSLISGCSQHQGMIHIKAITSNNLVDKSKKMLESLISKKIDYLNEENINDAKKIIQYHFFELISSYKSIASTILFMHRYNLEKDFLEKRFDEIKNISKDEILKSVSSVLNLNKLICLTVGR